MIRWLDTRLFAPAPAERLALVRVVAAVFAAATTAAIAPNVWRNAHLGAVGYRPTLPLVAWPGPPSQAVVAAALVISFAAAVAVAVGLWHRFTAPLLALAFLFVAGARSSWGMIFHTENLLALHLMVLATAPAADALSVDARRASRSQAVPGASGAYGWPLRLIAAVTASAYLLAGVAKLRWAGAEWATGEFLRNQIVYDNLRKLELGDLHSPLGAALARHPWIFAPLAWISLALELGAPLAVLRRRWTQRWAFGVVGFHLGIVALMAIAFPYPMTGAAFVASFDGERVVAWWRARRERKS